MELGFECTLLLLEGDETIWVELCPRPHLRLETTSVLDLPFNRRGTYCLRLKDSSAPFVLDAESGAVIAGNTRERVHAKSFKRPPLQSEPNQPH